MSVSFVRRAGGNAVPVFVDQPDDYYNQLLPRLNGLYLPGGASAVLDSGYADVAYRAFRIAKEMNDRGIYYPIWGICLGLEVMASWPYEPRIDPKSVTRGTNPKMMTLNFTESARSSIIFGAMPEKLYRDMQTIAMAANFHKYGVAIKTYQQSEAFQELFTVTSTNHDDNGMEYIATMEARNYPFYAFQWHPEKVHFMDTLVPAKDLKQPHKAFSMHRFMCEFLISEARKNNNSFLSNVERERFLFERFETQYEFHNSIKKVSFSNLETPQFESQNITQAAINQSNLFQIHTND